MTDAPRHPVEAGAPATPTGRGSRRRASIEGHPARCEQTRTAKVAGADPYLDLRGLADYSACSVRWLRDRLVDSAHPLPCYRLPGSKILVRRSEFDGWLARYRRVGNPDVDQIVADVLAGLNPAGPPAAR